MALPPDRSVVSTEQRHDGSTQLDAMSIDACIELMCDDARIVPEAVHAARKQLAGVIEDVAQALQSGGRLLYLGAGTSGRLGVLDASECPPTFHSDPAQVVGLIAGGDSALRTSSEGLEDDPHGAAEELKHLRVGAGDVVIGIAAGGTTPYVRGGITQAHSRGAKTALLTCSSCDPPEGCDHVVQIETGAEVLTGSTRLKAGSATKLALNIITTTAFVQLGKAYGNLMVDLRATNDKLTDRAIRILREFKPTLSRDHAAAVLERAHGRLKTAIVMVVCDVGSDEANDRLDAHARRLRDTLAGNVV